MLWSLSIPEKITSLCHASAQGYCQPWGTISSQSLKCIIVSDFTNPESWKYNYREVVDAEIYNNTNSQQL